jgi:hypothetical protein
MKADYEQIDQLVTREQILGMEPGEELDAAVAELMGYKITRVCGRPYIDSFSISKIPSFSTEISAAWEVVAKVKSMLFSKRRKFMDTLQFITSKNELTCRGHLINYPDVFWFITPEVICKAALITVMQEDINSGGGYING